MNWRNLLEVIVIPIRSISRPSGFLVVFGAIAFFFPEMIIAVWSTILSQAQRDMPFMTRTLLSAGGLVSTCIGLLWQRRRVSYKDV